VSQPLLGYVFCLTGKMWTERKFVAQRIEEAGGRISNNVESSNTILVIGGDGSEKHTVKAHRAREKGARTITHWNLKGVLDGRISFSHVLAGIVQSKPKASVEREDKSFDQERHERAKARLEDELASFDER
jgi:hypothetical protein